MSVKVLSAFATAPDCATEPAEVANPEKHRPKAATATASVLLAAI
jgi:hypothetical protein